MFEFSARSAAYLGFQPPTSGPRTRAYLGFFALVPISQRPAIGLPGPSYYEEIPYFRGEKKGKRKKEELERIWMRRERERQEEESFLVFLTEVIND